MLARFCRQWTSAGHIALQPLGQVDLELLMCSAELAFVVVAVLSGQKLPSQSVEAVE